MKLTTKLEKLTKEQEEYLSKIESKLDEISLAEIVFDEETAWEQWCDSHEDAFSVRRYSEGSNPYWYPAGTVFEEVEGPEGFDDLSEDEKWETPEGEEALNAANAAIDVIVKSIDRILETKNKDVLHDWFNDNEGDNLIYDCSDNNNADTDKVYDLVERLVFKG